MPAKSLEVCPALSDSMDCSLPGSSIHRILQARILEQLPGPLSGDLPDPGIEPVFLTSTCIGMWLLYHSHQLGSPEVTIVTLPPGRRKK